MMGFGIKVTYSLKDRFLKDSFFIWFLLICLLPGSGVTQTSSSVREEEQGL